MAVESGAARRRLGISQPVGGSGRSQPHRESRRAHAIGAARRAADTQRADQADPLLVRDGRSGSFLSKPDDPRRYARLDAVGRADGQGARREGLPLPVPVRAQRQACRPPDRRTDAAVSAGVVVERLSDSLNWIFERIFAVVTRLVRNCALGRVTWYSRAFVILPRGRGVL